MKTNVLAKPTMSFFSNHSLELEQRSFIVQIEQNTYGLHEHHVQQAVTQMLQINRPEPFGTISIGQLAEDGIIAILKRAP